MKKTFLIIISIALLLACKKEDKIISPRASSGLHDSYIIIDGDTIDYTDYSDTGESRYITGNIYHHFAKYKSYPTKSQTRIDFSLTAAPSSLVASYINGTTFSYLNNTANMHIDAFNSSGNWTRYYFMSGSINCTQYSYRYNQHTKLTFSGIFSTWWGTSSYKSISGKITFKNNTFYPSAYIP